MLFDGAKVINLQIVKEARKPADAAYVNKTSEQWMHAWQYFQRWHI